MLAQNVTNRAAYLEEYSYQTKEDQEILHSLHRESSCQGQSRICLMKGIFVLTFVYSLIFHIYMFLYFLLISLQRGNRPGHGP